MSFSKVLLSVTTQTILNRQEKLAEGKNKELFFLSLGLFIFVVFGGSGFLFWLVGWVLLLTNGYNCELDGSFSCCF